MILVALLWIIPMTASDCPLPIPNNVTRINCYGKQITHIPKLHPGLISVDLSHNHISSIPNGIFINLSSIQKLDLSLNQISSISNNTFVGLPSLRNLDLSSNQISSISNSTFVGLPSLRSLRLSGNEISSIQNGTFSHLSSLEYLDLSSNQISPISNSTFVDLPSLRSLILRGNRISSIQYGTFSHLPSLHSLELSSNEISSIQNGTFSNLSSLQYLDLSSNQISSISNSTFVDLPSLRSLDLSSNEISSIQNGTFFHVSSLHYLELSFNKISSISDGTFANLPSLTYILLHSNRISSLQNGIFANLPLLFYLHLASNQISSISNGTFANLPSLRSLYMYSNRISSLQSGTFSNLPSLETLELENNQISWIPSGTFYNLTSLRRLDIDKYKMFCLCEELESLSEVLNTTCIRLWKVSWKDLKPFQCTSLCVNGPTSLPVTINETTKTPALCRKGITSQPITTSGTMQTTISSHQKSAISLPTTKNETMKTPSITNKESTTPLLTTKNKTMTTPAVTKATINRTFNVHAGSDQMLPCKSSMSTPDKFQWIRGGQSLPSESQSLKELRVAKLISGSLLVRNVSTFDSGYYLCVADDRILYNVTINVEVIVDVQMELRILNVQYSEDFKNKSSDVYIKFEKNFTATMDQIYNETDGYNGTVILDIRNGSTKVDFKVVIVRVIKKPGRKEPAIKVEVAGKIITRIQQSNSRFLGSLQIDADPKTLQLKMAPPAPKEPQMEEVKATSVVIQWREPELHQYYHINGYIVGAKKFGSGHKWVNKTIAGTDVRKYILTNLDPETRYYVNVAATNQHGRGVATQPQALTTESAGLAGWAVALIVIVLLVLVAGVVIFLWYRKKYTAQKERRRKLYLDMAMEQSKSNPYDDNQKIKMESLSPKFSEVDGNWRKISWDNLQLSKVLGSGAFGKVYKGQVLVDEDKPMDCAVKTVKANATEEEKRDLYKELEIMSSVGSHPNLVNLIGACTKEDTLYIAIEFAANGCLHDYLKNNRLDSGGETPVSHITNHTKLMLALDVANGMAYLASKRCIHRDLAARNVLLTEDYRGKIADFGMSRDIYSEGVYEKKTAGKLPVRWMALEAIETFIFTAETDVWSYGVLLWEIEAGGITPWGGLNAKEIVHKLKNGGRLEQPADCSQEIYEIMLSCWEANPKERPNFKDLADRFEKLLEKEQTVKFGVNHSYEEENV